MIEVLKRGCYKYGSRRCDASAAASRGAEVRVGAAEREQLQLELKWLRVWLQEGG